MFLLNFFPADSLPGSSAERVSDSRPSQLLRRHLVHPQEDAGRNPHERPAPAAGTDAVKNVQVNCASHSKIFYNSCIIYHFKRYLLKRSILVVRDYILMKTKC